MAKITPHPHVLDSYANQPLTWAAAIAELVDNAFDASANRVEIRCNNRILSVSDDGHGIKDILAVVTLGSHKPHGIDGIGCYGVGAKDAALWCGSQVKVETIHSAVKTTMSIDWSAVTVSPDGSWEIPDPISVAVDKSEQSRTTIEIVLRPERKRGPSADALSQLQWKFTPALRTGRQLSYVIGNKRNILEALTIPPLQRSVRDTFVVEGKQVDIDIGILPEGSKMPYDGPFWVQYKHRIIAASSIGADRYNTSRLGGIITLGKGWRLSKNKDDFSDHGEQLKDAIFARIHALLEEAAALSESVESAAFDQAISDMLNSSDASKKREKRKKSDGEGTVVTTGRHGPRRHATSTTDNPGSVETPVGRKTGFTYETYFKDDESEFGRFDYPGARVYLNGNHPFVKLAKATDNTLAILAACWILIADFVSTHDTKMRGLMSFEHKDFKRSFSQFAYAHKYDTKGGAK